jgi:MATE family multidrug resistance protein
MRNRQILNIALPAIAANITVPLLGLVDVAIVGHMGSAAYIGAVAVGSMIFNLVYWLFGFLRMGTSGLTAQAFGRRDFSEVIRLMVRSMGVALSIGLAMIVLQVPLRWLMFWLIAPTADVMPLAKNYYRIVIWGAPASLSLFALTGWFIGMQNTRIPMFIAIMQNVVNIVVSLALVYGLGMKIEGVALGTVIAQYTALMTSLWLFGRYYGRLFNRHSSTSHLPPSTTSHLSLHDALSKVSAVLGDCRGFFTVNRDIFLRTLCLVSVNLFFTSAGARYGAVILSVNTVFMQFYLFYSYFMDGFAYAGEALCGRYYGAADRQAFSQTLRRLFLWTLGVTAVFTILYIGWGMDIVRLLTDEASVIATASQFVIWAWLIPAAGALAFLWDGIFIGITATRAMLLTSVVATLLFFVIYVVAVPTLANHALWLAQVVYLMARGVAQTIWYNKVFACTAK